MSSSTSKKLASLKAKPKDSSSVSKQTLSSKKRLASSMSDPANPPTAAKKTKASPSVPPTPSKSKSKPTLISRLKPPVKAAAVEEQNDGSSEEEEQNEQEEDAHLKGFSSQSEDSDSDEAGSDSDSDSESDDEEVDDAPLDVAKLPTIAKDDVSVKRRLEKAKRQPTVDRGVIYLGRIPHGFYEDQMREYFGQFGEVTRVRISRSKKTGRSKHYGFVEFASSAVADIVCETMDNYLLSGHILTCKIIPKDQVHPELWVGANRKWRKVPTDRIVRAIHNRERTAEEQAKTNKRLLKRQRQKQRKITAAGIDYDITSVGYKAKAAAA